MTSRFPPMTWMHGRFGHVRANIGWRCSAVTRVATVIFRRGQYAPHVFLISSHGRI